MMRLRIRMAAAATLLVAALLGCSGGSAPSGRPEIDAVPDAALYGASAKAVLYEFRAKVRKHGVAGAKQSLPELLENFEGFTALPADEYSATYKQIMEKLRELENSLAGSPNREAVVQAAEDIGKLADSLPGQASENPVVE